MRLRHESTLDFSKDNRVNVQEKLQMGAYSTRTILFDPFNCFYEVILLDPQRPEIRNDQKYNWVLNNRKRPMRGLTSTAKKARGLRNHDRRKKGKNIRKSMAK